MYASGANKRPSCASSVKIGTNDSVMMSSVKNSAGPTCTRGLADQRASVPALELVTRMVAAPALDVLVRVLDHHHRGIDHRADRNRDATQRHDVGVHALVVHDDEGHQHTERQRNDGDQRRAQVEQERQRRPARRRRTPR